MTGSPTDRTARCALSLIALLLVPPAAAARQANATALLEEMARLDGTPRVLVFTARPEHEPAGLIAWLHLAAGAEVSVVGLHRGEAGINRFAREVGEALGVLRVQEVVEARRITGGHHFFTRAYDFGEPGPGEDPLERWPVEEVVRDLVTIIRHRRPHLIIVGCLTPNGVPDRHAEAAWAFAEAAFLAAGDSAELPPAATARRPPWQPTHLDRIRCDDTPGAIAVPVGNQHLPRGMSYARIGGDALARQRTQGLGRIVLPGGPPATLDRMRSLRVDAGAAPALFDGVAARWRHLLDTAGPPDTLRPGIGRIAATLDAVQRNFDPRAPDAAIDSLLAALVATRATRALIPRSANPQLPWLEEWAEWDAVLSTLDERLTALTLAASGVEARLDAPRDRVAQRDSIAVTLTLFNAGARPVAVRGGSVTLGLTRRLPAPADSLTLLPGASASWTAQLMPLDPSVPWWLVSRRSGEGYAYPPNPDSRSDQLRGEGWGSEGRALVDLTIAGVELALRTEPVRAPRADPDRGEIREPLAVMPPITVLLERMLDYTLADRQFRRRLLVEVRSWTDRPRDVEVRVMPPDGVRVADGFRRLALAAGERRELLFELEGALPRGRSALRVIAESEGESFFHGAITIAYEHVPGAQLLRPAGLWLDAVPIRVPAQSEIGYLPGEQDFNQVALRQLNVRVTDLTAGDLDSIGLARFRRIAIGPHAFRTPEVRRAVPELLAWVRRGGRLVVQYGGTEITDAGILPWPFATAEPPRQLAGLQTRLGPAPGAAGWWRDPHVIDDDDLDDWRSPVARFLPDSVDARYRPIILAHQSADDPGTPVAWATPLGSGTLVYTTLALPPQVLSGEGGALRVLLNLLFAAGR